MLYSTVQCSAVQCSTVQCSVCQLCGAGPGEETGRDPLLDTGQGGIWERGAVEGSGIERIG